MKNRRAKVSTSALAIKLVTTLLTGLLPVLPGCATVIADAPFPLRSDTTVPGDLDGPFDGRVVEGDSTKPVVGAAVLASWAYQRDQDAPGIPTPSGARSMVVDTDADGRYQIERAARPFGMKVMRFTLVVYKRGYVAWRSDRRYSDLSVRHDFSQSGNLVHLEPMPPDASRANHLAFVGAGGPLLDRLLPELEQAAAESASAASGAGAEAVPTGNAAPPAGAAAGPKIDPGVLLSVEELKAVTGYQGGFELLPLADIPSSASYGSLHFKSEGASERYDAAIRVYHLSPDAATRRFEALAKELPSVEVKNEVGDRSLRSKEGEVLGLAALDEKRGVVLVFTCGAGLCPDADTAVSLMKRMWPRLDRLSRPEGGEQTAPVEQTPPAEKLEAEPPRGTMQLRPPQMLRPRTAPPEEGSP